jgi:hypothetical protein
MADIKSFDRVFPLFINEAVQTIATAGALPVNETSYIQVNPGSGDVSYTVADGTIAGQMVVIHNVNASNNDANITFTTAFDAEQNAVSLDTDGTQCLAMWTGSAWIVLAGEAATSVA